MRGRLRRLAAGLGAACALAGGALAPAARASSVSVGGGTPATLVGFMGAGSEQNTVSIQVTPGQATVSDATAELTAGDGCSQVDAHTADCQLPAGTIADVSADLGLGHDTLTVDGGHLVRVYGGLAGDDITVSNAARAELNGGDGNDVLRATGNGDAWFWGDEGNDDLSVAGGPGEMSGGGGDDRITGGEFADGLDGGMGRDHLDGGGGDDGLEGDWDADVIAGGPGNDTVVWEPQTAVDVSLDDVANDGTPGEGDNVRSDVENVDATQVQVAHIVGSDAANTLTCRDDCTIAGLGGNDILRAGARSTVDGGAGDDDLYLWVNAPPWGVGQEDLHGGPGTDTVHVAAADPGDTTVITLDDDAHDGFAGAPDDNVHSDIENVDGGAEDDVLVGGDGPNRLSGGDGSDVLDGGGGPDVLDGGGGDEDVVTYEGRTVGVHVSPDGVADDGAPGEGDDVGADVEFVIGTSGNDDLHAGPHASYIDGGAGDDDVTGGPGDDWLIGGPGADVIHGGGGEDVASYGNGDPGPVTVTLDGLANDGAAGEGDLVATDVEDVWGSPSADTLVGDAAANVLWGYYGNDVIVGGAGSDTLVGQDGDDHVEARDGEQDEIDCNPGEADSATVDLVDAVFDCATVDLPAGTPPATPVPPPPPSPPTPPAPPVPVPAPPVVTQPPAAVPALRLGKVRVIRRATLLVTVSCPQTRWGDCRGDLAATATGRHPRALGRIAFHVPVGKTRTVRITLGRSARQALAHRATVHLALRMTVRDGGHSRTVVRQVTAHLG